MAGHGFSFGWGQVVEADVFAAKVGAGWERKCEPVEETAAAVPAPETAVVRPALETATKRRRK